MRKIDLTGQKFNKLLVLEEDLLNKDNKGAKWICQCDCGNKVSVKGIFLRNGHTQSCGCLKQKHGKEMGKKRAINLTNQTFGKLTALFPTEKRTEDGYVIWTCKCECGNICDVSSRFLVKGGTKSCGCLKSSGEEKITLLLKNNNIAFKKQKTFELCRFEDTNRLAYFDFWVNNSYLIEFDGEQHFKFAYGEKTWNTKENLEKTQKRDNYKNQWCKDNNIPLIRIPYWHLEKLCIEDLLPETSKFIIE